MTVEPINATGWINLTDGHPIAAATTMFNTAFSGYFIVMLFFIFEMLLYYKTKSFTMCWVTSSFFTALMYGYIPIPARSLLLFILVFSLAYMIYFNFFKE